MRRRAAKEIAPHTEVGLTHARHWRLLLVLAVVLGWPARADAQSADRADADTAETAAPAEGPDEQMQTLIADMDKLNKYKFSGYVQVRWETSENKSDSVRVTGSPATITPARSVTSTR